MTRDAWFIAAGWMAVAVAEEVGRLDALLARCGSVPEPAWPGSS